MANVFSVEIFFIVFRETLEASVIISVLLAFIKQGLGRGVNYDKKLYRKLLWQVWGGAALGLLICLAVGGAFIGVFYSLGKDIWASSEDLWEGIFSIIATCMITVMGLGMLRINKMKEKWRVKIAEAIINTENSDAKKKWSIVRWSKKYALALLPFITTLREGVEAIVFVGGVSLGTPATAFPLAVICGLAAGCGIGYLIYRGGNVLSMQYFLIASTCFLYLISAGLFSRAVWYLQMYRFSQAAGGDVAEMGSGPGSYDIRQSVWHVNCCNPETDGGWEIFNALFGWQNSADIGSVVSYNLYWLFIILVVLGMLYQEKTGMVPFHKIPYFAKKQKSKQEAREMMERAERVAAMRYGGTTAETSSTSIGETGSEQHDESKAVSAPDSVVELSDLEGQRH